MIEYIKGELTELSPAMATVEAAGVYFFDDLQCHSGQNRREAVRL